MNTVFVVHLLPGGGREGGEGTTISLPFRLKFSAVCASVLNTCVLLCIFFLDRSGLLSWKRREREVIFVLESLWRSLRQTFITYSTVVPLNVVPIHVDVCAQDYCSCRTGHACSVLMDRILL